MPIHKLPVIIFALVLSISGADARRRHHHHGQNSALLSEESDLATEHSLWEGGAGRKQQASSDEDDVTSWLPVGWKLQPSEPNWKGKRYVSPDGFAAISIFSSDRTEQSVALQMRDIAFTEGEQVSYLRGERDWIVVSGSKDNHIFYRKAALACGGKSWHRIEFEYPFEDKAKLDTLVILFSRRLDLYRNAGCQPNVAAQ